MQNRARCYLAIMTIWLLLLAGCGGSAGNGGTSITPTGTTKVSGVAATGTPLSGTVYLKDSSNPAKELSVPISADGSFSFDVSGLSAPFVLKAVGTANGQNYTLYSFATAAGTANVNPLSHLAVMLANNGTDPAALYSTPTTSQLQTVAAALNTAISQVQARFQPVLAQYGAATKNFISDNYTVNHMGLDLLFDMVGIDVNNGTLTMTNKVANSVIYTVTLNGNSLDGQLQTANIPSVPNQLSGNVYIYPASASISVGSTVNFKAVAMGIANQAFSWSVVEPTGGSISYFGIYTAPSTPGTYHIKAVSGASTDANPINATVAITVTGSSSTWNFLSTGLPTIDEVSALVIDPNSQAVYAALTGDGVYKSSNGGASWSATNSGLPASLSIYSLAIDPTNGQVIYAGTTDSGVYKSTNGGASWAQSGLGTNIVNSLVIDPHNPQILYAATYTGTYKSVNGGTTWSALNVGIILTLAMDPNDSQTLYLSTDSSICKTTDGGNSWTVIGPKVQSVGVQAKTIAVDPANSQNIYLAAYGNGIYKSIDGGSSWSASNSGMGLTTPSVYALAFNPTNSQTIYAGTANGVFISKDGGGSWTAVNAGFPVGATTVAVTTLSYQASSAKLFAGVFYKTVNVTGNAIYSGLIQ